MNDTPSTDTDETLKMTPERINDMRRRIAAGEEPSEEELKQVFRYYYELRGERVAKASAPKKGKGKTLTTEEAQSLLDGLSL